MDILKVPGYKNIYEVERFEDEFSRLIKDSGEKIRYHNWLDRSLMSLDEMGQKAITQMHFEFICGYGEDIYSIRYPNSKKNPRVIFFFFEDSSPILLTSFLEKSPSDYCRGCRRAVTRVKALRKEFKL